MGNNRQGQNWQIIDFPQSDGLANVVFVGPK